MSEQQIKQHNLKRYGIATVVVTGLLVVMWLTLEFSFFTTTAQADEVTSKVQTLYNESCATCHASGVLGAARTGDKAAWAALMKKGMPVLLQHTKEGYKNMPARGLCSRCSDQDFTDLINYMSK